MATDGPKTIPATSNRRPQVIIYKATNLVNGKVYIGQTINGLQKRRSSHLCSSRQKQPKQNHFHNAIRRYGKDNFKWELIDRANNMDRLNEKEICWISIHNSTNPSIGYNKEIGGRNSPCPEHVKKLISERMKNFVFTTEHKMKISKSNKGDGNGRCKISKIIAVKIKKMISESHGNVHISECLNVSIDTVKKIKYGVIWKHIPWPDDYEKNDLRNPLSKNQVATVKKMICEGKSFKDILSKVKISKSQLGNIMHNKTWESIPWPGKYKKYSFRHHIGPHDVKQIKQMLSSGVRECDISRSLNISRNIIQSIKSEKTWKDIPWD